MYSDRQAWGNSVDLDETPQNAASHKGIHCLPIIQQFLDTTMNKLYLFKFLKRMVRSWGVRIISVNTVYVVMQQKRVLGGQKIFEAVILTSSRH